MNALSYFLAGLTLFLFGLAIAVGGAYPRWAGLIAVVSGAALMYNGVIEVAYEGFVGSVVKLVGLLLVAVWAFAMAMLIGAKAAAGASRVWDRRRHLPGRGGPPAAEGALGIGSYPSIHPSAWKANSQKFAKKLR